ncbi:MAG: redoxin domain-containing protein [Methylococcales bacterium]|jgi:thiol-disulfide isomerase/thioredoxin|nr:redoxin domain-containing protein [Methylococcales bacterium]MBT3816499.1 redoxin domain-containing protein [Methylococcales bacterium]MBT4032419.1 redoxin domain-containing protein [Methylococcales bacterium]MBT4348340.1 redoxin domain-containing protein [Methylococcales bacterium]MBT4599094.1 redoxin domain-containing protein [Methylococcales bacterium]
MSLRKSLFYGFLVLIVLVGQQVVNRDLVEGVPPKVHGAVINNKVPWEGAIEGPGVIYFWASWCGICQSIQGTMSDVLVQMSGMTVAVKSGSNEDVQKYLKKSELDWPVVNDADGAIGDAFGIRGVPTIFVIGPSGKIKFTAVGYTSAIGLQLRLWLAGFE